MLPAEIRARASLNAPMHEQSSVMVLLVSLVIFLNLYSGVDSVKLDHPNTLLVISVDGLSWEVVKNRTAYANITNILRIVDDGVSADNMKNVFPTITWPNHISLLTGLYPIHHGLVANKFWDPKLKELSDNYNPKFFKNAEQIWMTYQKQGGRSAVYFWPGFSSYEMKPTYYEKGRCFGDWPCRPNFSQPLDERVDKIIGWMKSAEPPRFIAFYVNEPDGPLHDCGYCLRYKKDIELVDVKVIGYLLDRLQQESLLDSTNIVLTSDHGILPVKDYLFLEDFVNPIPTDAILIYQGPYIQIWPASDEQLEDMYNAIKGKDARVSVYKKQEIPDELNWRDNDRIPPLLVMAAREYLIRIRRPALTGKGGHGWSSEIPEMWSTFAAIGPDFKRKFKMKKGFQNIDLYPVFCHLLGIEPNPYDGNIDNVAEMLVNPPTKADAHGASPSVIGMSVLCISALKLCVMN